MRAVIQRVSRAQVRIKDRITGEIGNGIVILLGVHRGDAPEQARWLADKCVGLRIFRDQGGAMNLSLEETGGAILVVSQFTLYGDCRKGRRPSFVEAAGGEAADPLYQEFCRQLEERGMRVERGVFGAEMEVELVNDGPVTILVDSPS